MKTYTISKREYHYVEDLKDQPCFVGCSGSNSRFLKRRELDEDTDYNYFRYIDGKYVVSRVRTKGTYLMVTKEWVDRFNASTNLKVRLEEPPRLKLGDIKPFSDDEGNTYDVEIRGERDYAKCYFLAKDIAALFGITKLEHYMTRSDNCKYQEGIHYRRFYNAKQERCTSTAKDTVLTQHGRLFLTYKGLLRAIFAANSGKTDRFVDWVCQIVYTAHLGTVEQKTNLASDLMGLSKDQVKVFFNTCLAPVSGIYLIRLGTAKDLRKTFDIPKSYSDDLIIYKYGRSDNIAKRYHKHAATYRKLKIYDIKLVYYCPVDESMTSAAESDLKNKLMDHGMKLDHPIHTELAIFEEKGKRIKTLLSDLHKIHISTNIALIAKLKKANYMISTQTMKIEHLSDKINTQEEHYKQRIANLQATYEAKLELLQHKYNAIKEIV